jgi:hypothetical protein
MGRKEAGETRLVSIQFPRWFDRSIPSIIIRGLFFTVMRDISQVDIELMLHGKFLTAFSTFVSTWRAMRESCVHF